MVYSQGKPLPQIWLKAAMLGSLWASVEIVLGSFLHNLRVPLSGTILAALGVMIMINGYKLWPEKGLFWRAALVTALMKSISPSAIILGPMVGIFMEGVLLEIMVRGFRRHWIGFILGGALAVSWSLFQKILTLLITFGPDLVKLYEQLYYMAAKTLQIKDSVPMDLVLLLLLMDLGLGALVAGIAWNTRQIRSRQSEIMEAQEAAVDPKSFLASSVDQRYSVLLLFVNLCVLLGTLNLSEHLTLPTLGLVTFAYIALVLYRYQNSLNRLKRPLLWLQLITIMLLSGVVLGGWGSWLELREGFAFGAGMSLRAILVIIGFSVISIELRNPVIIDWFMRRGMGVIIESVSLAFEVLPLMLKLLAQQKQKWKHPFKTLLSLLGALESLRRKHDQPLARVLFITGDQGDGKTQLLDRYLNSAHARTLNIQGIITDGVWVEDERDHYHVRDIGTGTRVLLCDRDLPQSKIQAGPFNFREPGLQFGLSVLNAAADLNPDMVIIDEIGHLERFGKGWSSAMDVLVNKGQTMIWSVRPSLLDDIASKWPIGYELYSAGDSKVGELEEVIRRFVSSD